MGGFRTNNVLNAKIKMRKFGLDYESPTEQSGADDSEDGTDSDLSEDYHRGTWSRKTDFLLSIVGYSVGVSNIWRFPYLCIRNGGGAFLIPFFFFLLFCGIPLFFLELCLGQFSGVSSLFVWKLCPMFQGLGYLMVIVSAMMSWYYITVIVWVLYYLVSSFYDPLPWSTCTNDWNTDKCITSRYQGHDSDLHAYNTTPGVNVTVNQWNQTTKAILSNQSRTAAKEFWQERVLQISKGLEEVGTLQPHLVIGLAVAWILVFLCLMKGIKSVGKVVYVTAVLPYLLLTTFLIRGLMLDGSLNGIIFYLKPDFSKLLELQVWLEAGIQVFYSLGPAWGGLITMSSYNKFNNNCLRDAIIGSLADGLTSFYAGFVVFAVLGHLSYENGLKINEVADSGPGLALVAYPEAMLKLPLPQLWAVLFFVMLLTLGIDSQFGTFETVSSGLADAFPKQLGKRKAPLTAILCTVLFVLGLPFTTNAGMYFFQIVDWYAASLCVMLTSFLECIIVGWIYGADRFSKDVQMMLGFPVNIVIRICWCILTPLVMLVTFIVTLTQYQPPTYEGYTYPGFARVIGLLLSIIPLIPLPVLSLCNIIRTEGSFFQRIFKLLQPAADWGPHIQEYKKIYLETKETKDHSAKINPLVKIKKNLFGSMMK